MKIRNNTTKKLVFYFGDSYKEEPIIVVPLLPGIALDLESYLNEDISIQES